jgi:lantibiotic biosynthesis protein
MNSNAEKYKQAAVTIGNKICRDAIWHGNTCNWVGLATETGIAGRVVYSRALPPHFYDGTAGVAFFLLHLYQTHPHPVFEKTLKGVLQHLHSQKLSDEEQLNGFYQGRAGVIYVLHYAAKILQNNAYALKADEFLSLLLASVEEEKDTDIISGAAGIILFLLELSCQHIKGEELTHAAIKLGEKLIAKAQKSSEGYSWKTMEGIQQNLTGFAHGASGIAAALCKLFAQTNNETFLHACKEAIRYEDAFFNAQQQNWPDFRFINSNKKAEDETCSLAWCHGAPGIGWTRLRLYQLTGDSSFLKHVDAAITSTKKYLNAEAVNNFSLCHGLFGNAAFLLSASHILNREELKKDVFILAEECIHQFIKKNIPVPGGYGTLLESPCFMQGSSGVGYFFLCLLNEKMLPDVLMPF